MSRFIVSLICSTLLLSSGFVRAAQSEAVWVLQSDGVLKISPVDATVAIDVIDTGDNGAIAVDAVNGDVWVYTTGRLRALDANGHLSVDIVNPSLPSSYGSFLAVNGSNGRVFLAASNTLYVFDEAGALLGTHVFPEALTSLSVDGNRGVLWLTAGDRELYRYDSVNTPEKVLLGNSWEDARTVVFDAKADALWVLRYSAIERFSGTGSNGTSTAFPPDEYIRYLAGDGMGGVWAADHDDLYRLNSDFQWSGEINVFAGPQWYWWWGEMNVRGLSSDASDGSVWVTVDRMLQHYSVDGSKVHEFHAELADGRRPRIWKTATGPDKARPSLRITSPVNGTHTNDSQPGVTVAYVETGGTIQRDTLRLTWNDQTVSASCTNNSSSASCELHDIVDDGEYELRALAKDDLGVEVASSPVMFHVDTVPPTIVFNEPENGSYTNQTSVTVNGSLSEPATFKVNDAAFSVDGAHQFTATVALAEGPNTIRADAQDTAGNTSTASVTVIRDTTVPAPINTAALGFTLTDTGEVLVSAPDGTVESGASVTVRNIRTGQTVSVIVSAAGSFSVAIAADEGDLLEIAVADSAGNSSTMESISVPDLSALVQIEFSQPANGVSLNTNSPIIEIRYLQNGSGVDYTSLSFEVNDTPASVDCVHAGSMSRCIPASTLDDGSYLVHAIVNDVNRKASNVAATSFVIDTVPPSLPDAEKITLTQLTEGAVIVTGQAGSVDASAIVSVTSTSSEATVIATADGAFEVAFNAVTGENVYLATSDVAGNTSPPVAFVVPQLAFSLSIAEPSSDAIVTTDTIDISGAHNGPFGTGITVNGVSAIVNAGNFLALNVPVSLGENEIEARGVTPDGRESAISVHVTGVEPEPIPVKIVASRGTGPTPLRVNFRIVSAVDLNQVRGVEIDYEGDGIVDARHVNIEHDFVHTFQSPGTYSPWARLVTDANAYEADTTVVVYPPEELDAHLRQILNKFHSSLIAGDIEAVYQTMSPNAVQRYKPLFEQASEAIVAGAATYSQPIPLALKPNYATYLITREKNGKTYGFEVRFTRGTDGVWKITSL